MDSLKTCYQIQSLSIGSKYILVGTTNGNIYELAIPSDANLDENMENMINLRMTSHDNEIPKVQCLNTNNNILYTISQSGQFCVWEMSSLA